jgi:hypothetical protein
MKYDTNCYGETQWFEPGDLVRDLITEELARVVNVEIDDDGSFFYELDIDDDEGVRTVFEVVCPETELEFGKNQYGFMNPVPIPVSVYAKRS